MRNLPATPILAFGLILLTACSREESSDPVPGPSTAAPKEAVTNFPFIDIAPTAGIDFIHWNGMTGERYFVEPVGSGGALVDLDNDGDLDLFLVQGSLLAPTDTGAAPLTPPPAHSGG